MNRYPVQRPGVSTREILQLRPPVAFCSRIHQWLSPTASTSGIFNRVHQWHLSAGKGC